MDGSKNGMWIIPFKKFNMLKVKIHFVHASRDQVYLVYERFNFVPVFASC